MGREASESASGGHAGAKVGKGWQVRAALLAGLSAWLAVPDPAAAVVLLGHMRGRAGDRLTAFEMVSRVSLDLVQQHIPGARDPLPAAHPWYVLAELSDTCADTDLAALMDALLAEALESNVVQDGAVAASDTQAQALWALREHISEAQKREGFSIKHDISLPVSAIPHFLDDTAGCLDAAYPGLRIVCFGHLGDGNLHYNLSLPVQADNAALIARSVDVSTLVHDRVQAYGGSISAEHGIGQLKRGLLPRYKSDVELDLMRRLKAALDPAGRMNPGKVL